MNVPVLKIWDHSRLYIICKQMVRNKNVQSIIRHGVGLCSFANVHDKDLLFRKCIYKSFESCFFTEVDLLKAWRLWTWYLISKWRLHNLNTFNTWWRHQMETFSALQALCGWNSPVTGEFPAQSPVTRSFDVFFDLCLNKRLSKQSWRCWFETPSRSLWRHSNEIIALWHSWYALTSLRHHDACRCLGVKRVPDRMQTSCWLDCDYDATWSYHYSDVMMGAMASQITSLKIVYSTVYSGADQRKHQSSASLALRGEFTGDRGIPRTNGQ